MAPREDCKPERIRDTLKNIRSKTRKATLFIGAGCSVSAGIPLAGKIVAEHKDKFPQAYADALAKHPRERMVSY